MQTAPNLSAARTPSQLAAGCAGFHLSTPTGGAANGMPLNVVTPVTAEGTPDTRPLAVRTGPPDPSDCRSSRLGPAAAATATQRVLSASAIIQRLMQHLAVISCS